MMTARVAMIGLALTSVMALSASPARPADIYGPGSVGGFKDAPFVPAAAWVGFYAGVNGGYAFDAQERHGGVLDDGGFGGGQIGYNWQGFGLNRNIVLGLEADFQGTGINNSGNTTIHWDSGISEGATHNISLDYLGTVRGRAGYAWGPTLLYFTGGFAYGDVKNQFDTVSGNIYKTDSTQIGYVLGGGVEYKINPNWSLKAEYQYIDLGHEDAVGPTGTIRTKDTELNTVRGGVNYHLLAPYEPLK